MKDEKTIIDSLILYNENFEFATRKLKPSHFKKLRKQYETIVGLYEKYGKVTIIDLLEFSIDYEVPSVGLKDQLFKNFVARFFDKSIVENFNKELHKVEIKNILELDGFIEDIQSRISIAYDRTLPKKDNQTKINDLLKDIENRSKGGATNHIKTGFDLIDKKVIGIPKGHITIVAGRPGMGKTDFMLQLSKNILAQNYKIGIVSLEMTFAELQARNISDIAKIDSRKIESGELSKNEFEAIKSAAAKLSSDNYVVDDSSRQTPNSIKSTLRRWINDGRVDVVFIDYLTLIRTNFNRQRFDLEIGQLSQELREFAKETKLPIVLLSQLNRAVESRPSKKPFLSDLRESGSIEQDSALVMFLHRPSYYGIDPFQADYKGVSLLCKNDSVDAVDIANVIIAKARNGQTGTVPLKYVPKYHSFENIEILNNYKPAVNDDYPF